MNKLKNALKFLLLTSIVLIFLYLTFFVEKNIRMSVYQLFGGLSIFLYGMSRMTNALEMLAGENIRNIFEKFTNNRFFALLTGITVTSLIQSSSATTVMVVGFVNAAMMNLKQAAGVIMGANIGTTITGQLIAFKISKYAYLILAIGALLFFLAKTKKYRMIGQVFIGFGLLFLGMDLMKDVVSPLKDSKEVTAYIASFSGNIFAGVIIGTIFTFILQSSSATVAITMTMAASGLIDFPTSVALILGDNIGTTITAQLAALPARRSAKRAALLHTIFNCLGVVFVILIFPYYLKLIKHITPAGSGIDRMVANSHTMFNVVNALIFLPFTGYLAKICYILIPKTENEVHMEQNFLDKRLLHVPALAVEAAKKECLRMSDFASESLKNSIKLIWNFDYKTAKTINEKEDIIDKTENDIVNYLVLIEEKSISKNDSVNIVKLIDFANNLERIGDQCENIERIMTDKSERKIKFSEEAETQLRKMCELTENMFELSCKSIHEFNIPLAKKVYEIEKELNELEISARNNHVDRLCHGKCSHVAGYFYLDIMEKMERIGDHCVNIADLVCTGNYVSIDHKFQDQ